MCNTVRHLPSGGSFALCALLLIASMAGHLISDMVCASPGRTVAARCDAGGSRVISPDHADSSTHASLAVSSGTLLVAPETLTFSAAALALLPLVAPPDLPLQPPRVSLVHQA